MKHVAPRFLLLPLLALLLPWTSVRADADYDAADTHVFLDDELTFVEVTMDAGDLRSFLDDPWQDEYVPCTVRIHNSLVDETHEQVGIRVRGNTSRGSIKKSWKLSFNTFVPGRQFHGLEKLNLNGEHNDPTITRAMLSWDLMRAAGVPAARARHAHLTINDGALVSGIYINVEQIDEEYVESRYGNKNGNLYKCLYKGAKADLRYLPPGDGAVYAALGDGRTYVERNNAAADYEDLAAFIDFINNSDQAAFAAELPLRFSVNAFLKAMAVDVALANWDNYWYGANNYYLYHNEDTDRFEYIPYDLDNTYGVDFFGIDWATRPYAGWGQGGYGSTDGRLPPLIRRILATPVFEAQLRRDLRDVLQGPFPLATVDDRIDQARTMIQPYAFQGSFAGGNMDWGYDADVFDQAFDAPTGYVNRDGGWDHGLKPFLARRLAYLLPTVPAPAPTIALRLNEFMAGNDSTLQDEAGQYDDWVEIHNAGPLPVNLGGMYLTDDLTRPTRWVFPDATLEPGGFLVVWCDDDPGQGPLHTTFKLDADGEELGLFASLALGNVELDRHAFGPQTADLSEGRSSDGVGPWLVLLRPSPGASNQLETAADLPGAPRLLPCYPNPFNAHANLNFTVPSTMYVTLEIFDLTGRRVRSLHDGPAEAGLHERVWNGEDDHGRGLPSGSYLYRLEADGHLETRRMVMVK